MSIVREAKAEWRGDLTTGRGNLKLGSLAFQGPYSFKGRTTEGSKETNPEELLGAAHAGCFTMQLSALLTLSNHPPDSIVTTAKVYLDASNSGYSISQIDLDTSVKVSGLTPNEFNEIAEKAKTICPLSKALAATKINLKATLV